MLNIVILDDYQDTVRKLQCAARLDGFNAKVYTNTVKGMGQLAVRLRDADVIVLIRERTPLSRQLIEKLPKLKLIAHELLVKLKDNLSVDWARRDAARARMRVLVKRILRHYGYPPDLQDAAVQTVLQQAEAGPDASEMPIRAILQQQLVPVTVNFAAS